MPSMQGDILSTTLSTFPTLLHGPSPSIDDRPHRPYMPIMQLGRSNDKWRAERGGGTAYSCWSVHGIRRRGTEEEGRVETEEGERRSLLQKGVSEGLGRSDEMRSKSAFL